MADVYYLKVIAIVNRSSSEGPSDTQTDGTLYFNMRKDKSGYQTTVKLTYLRVIVLPWVK